MPIVNEPSSWPQDANSANRSREETADYIRALLTEREGLVRRGLDERVALVDAELKRLGHGAEAPEKRAERRPASRSYTNR